MSKYQGDGSVTHAEYTWFAGNQLKRVDSTFPGECDVAYITGGLGKRRLKSVDPDGAAEVTWYRYDAGWNEIASYNDTGDFWDIGTRSSSFFYAGMTALARVGGSNPGSSLWWQPYMDDHSEESQCDSVARQALRSNAERVGSARATYLGSTRMGGTDYLPYGEVRQAVGIQPAFTFTGKRHDAETGLYYFPYRYYSSTTARWLSRDPLGMVDGPNVYAYVRGAPSLSTDAMGLSAWPQNPFEPGPAPPPLPEVQSCLRRALDIADNATGAKTSIRHCVAVCEIKRCYGSFVAWAADLVNALMEQLGHEIEQRTGWDWGSDDYDQDILAGEDGRDLTCDDGETCTQACRRRGW